MSKGKTIQELAAELTRVKESSRDIIVPTSMMEMNAVGQTLTLDVKGEHFGATNWAHSQMGQFTNIPKQYYDRILSENPSLLASSVNHGFEMAIQQALLKKKSSARMIRTVDGNVRGFLSSKYRRLDSYDLLEVIFPILLENGFEVQSSELTEKKMYLKATTPKITADVKVGHPVNYGIVISSSDVGCGSLQVSPFLNELICTNMMTMEQTIRKYHVGKNQATDDIQELLTDATKEAADKAFWMEVRDIVNGTMKLDVFENQMDKLREAEGQEIKSKKIEKVVELTMKEVGVTGDKVKESIIACLASGNDGRGMNKWGLANAFTFAAHDVEDATYEEASDLERAGGKIIELPRSRWEALAA